MTMVNRSVPPPGTDPDGWAGDVFEKVGFPADWCTVRQAQEISNAGIEPKSLLEQIARGSVDSRIYTPEEARALLEVLQRSARKEQ